MHSSLRSALTATVVAQRHAEADRERLARLAVGRSAPMRNVFSRFRRFAIMHTPERPLVADLVSPAIADTRDQPPPTASETR